MLQPDSPRDPVPMHEDRGLPDGPPAVRASRAGAGLIWLLSSAVVLAAWAAPAAGQRLVQPESRRELLVLSTGGTVPYFRTLPLDRDAAVRRVVLVVHGNRRDADRYHARLIAAASLEGGVPRAALIAPQFQTLDDGPARGGHYWSSGGWKIGHRSRDRARISSFAVLDELLARVCPDGPDTQQIFPGLDTLVLVGHSAGGQFVQRYAAGGAGCPDAGVEVRYVVMNPSSYLYLDGRRPSASGQLELPGGACRGHDDYKYGLRDLNTYMQGVGPERIRANLFARRVFYVAGELDVGRGGSLDRRCEAELQGPHRLARHQGYRAHTRLFDAWKGSVFETIPGVGHSGRRMLASEQVRRILFR